MWIRQRLFRLLSPINIALGEGATIVNECCRIRGGGQDAHIGRTIDRWSCICNWFARLVFEVGLGRYRYHGKWCRLRSCKAKEGISQISTLVGGVKWLSLEELLLLVAGSASGKPAFSKNFSTTPARRP